MCWSANATVENSGRVPTVAAYLHVRFENPQETFPEPKEWYKGSAGIATPEGTPPARLWKVTFEIRVPPGETRHVGWEWEDSIDCKVGTAVPIPEGMDQRMGAILPFVEHDGAHPRLVATADPDEASGLTVTELRYAAAPDRLPLDALIENGEALAGLDWTVPDIALPAKLAPGDALSPHALPSRPPSEMRSFVFVVRTESPDASNASRTFFHGPAALLIASAKGTDRRT
jgi:hypothetical protein